MLTPIPLGEFFLVGLCAYLIGSISTAILTCRLLGLPDPRSQGSGNPGATNVMRIGGKKAAAITLMGDALKGFLPVLIVTVLKLHPATIAFSALMAFMGHLYPIFFRFQGGKGVATSFGALLALAPKLAIVMLIIWFTVNRVTKISSIAALTAAIVLPIIMWLFNLSVYSYWVIIVMVIFLIIRHRTNIVKLWRGEEYRFRNHQTQSSSSDQVNSRSED